MRSLTAKVFNENLNFSLGKTQGLHKDLFYGTPKIFSWEPYENLNEVFKEKLPLELRFL